MSIGLSKKLQLGRQGTQWIFVPSFATGEESLPSRASAPPPHPEQYRSDPHHGSCRPLASFEGDAIRRHHRMNGEPAPKQATSRKSRCKLLEVDQTDEINLSNLRRVFWNLPKSKYFATRKTRKPTKNRTAT